MNNNIENIKIEEIKTKENFLNNSDSVPVEIKDEAKLLLEAHNASKLSHKDIFNSIKEKVDNIDSEICEIKENIVLTSDIPTKMSDLENNLGFVSEEKLGNAIEIMGLVNNDKLSETINQTKNELSNSIQASSNTLLFEISNLESKIPDGETITDLVSRSDKFINLAPPANEGTVTIPENGILHFDVKGSAASNGGWFIARDMATLNPRVEINFISLNQIISLDFMVEKGNIIKFQTGDVDFRKLTFYYLKGNAPSEEVEGQKE